MAIDNSRIQELLKAWGSRTITAAEELELTALLKEEQADSAVHEHIQSLVANYQPGELLPAIDWEKVFEVIQTKKQQSDQQTPVRSINRKRWWWAAASIIIIAGVAAWLLIGR
ncbi:MAG TPA: hypothetical protein VHM26_17690, partial [Chitinophagaceae bacterium]|nr:hypothetical protein [Chitinophagaceae bacterium]